MDSWERALASQQEVGSKGTGSQAGASTPGGKHRRAECSACGRRACQAASKGRMPSQRGQPALDWKHLISAHRVATSGWPLAVMMMQGNCGGGEE